MKLIIVIVMMHVGDSVPTVEILPARSSNMEGCAAEANLAAARAARAGIKGQLTSHCYYQPAGETDAETKARFSTRTG
jgi:hypothetical protein